MHLSSSVSMGTWTVHTSTICMSGAVLQLCSAHVNLDGTFAPAFHRNTEPGTYL